MSGTNSPQGGLTRRSFLKTTGVAAGAAALAGSANLTALAAEDIAEQAATGEQKFQGACRGNCMGGCPVSITVRDGYVVKTEASEVPRPEYKRICQRGRSHLQIMYNEKRIQYPLRRIDGTERGAGEWERVSWEDAIGEICTKWKEIQAEYGPSGIGISTGSGNYGLAFGITDNMIGWGSRFINVMNATMVHHNYDMNVGRFSQVTGYGVNIFPHRLKNANVIVVWGGNPTEAIPHTWRFVMEAKQQGTKLVVIDPNFTIAASHADLWVPVRPGSDGALALALANMAYRQGRHNVEGLQTFSTAPFLVREDDGRILKASMLLEDVSEEDDEALVLTQEGSPERASLVSNPILEGEFEVDGIKVKTVFTKVLENTEQWTPELAAELCDIDVETIGELLDLFAEGGPVSTIIGLGIDHYSNGANAYNSIGWLHAVTGNVTPEGAGVDQFDMASLNWFSNVAMSMPLGMTSSPKIPFTKLCEVLDTEMFGKIPLTIKSLLVLNHNPLSNQKGHSRIIESFAKLDLIVVSDIVMTDTCRYADIILPCAHWFEQQDAACLYSPFLTLQEKATEPLFESKDNYEIIKLLADGMGIGKMFDFSREEFIQQCVDSKTFAMFGMNYDRLKKEKILTFVGYDGGTCVNNADGRVKIYFGDATDVGNRANFYDVGLDLDWSTMAYPTWEPPREAWTETVAGFEKSAESEKYPLVYSSYRNKMRCHTQFGYNPWLLELFPEPTVMANGRLLEERGVKHGDYAKVYNDRGYVVARVVENNGIHDNMVVMPKGWQGDQFVEGHYSDLGGMEMNPFCSNNEFFDTLCELELWKEGER